jgi:hypothetical protein
MTERVALCWAEPGDVNGRFMDSVLQVIYEDRDAVTQGFKKDYSVVGHIWIESGPRIAAARNTLVRRFLEREEWKDVEWLLMLDADMVFEKSFLHQMFDGVRDQNGKIQRPIVGGLCFGGGHGSILPTMYRMVDPKTNNGSAISIVANWKDGEVVEVDATGAACLLIHRGVLEHMGALYEEPTPWFAESQYKPEGADRAQDFGEDWTFCTRARKQGYPIFVNTAAKVGHMKPVMMNEAMWKTGHSGLKSIAGFASPEALANQTPAEAPRVSRQTRRRLARERQ